MYLAVALDRAPAGLNALGAPCIGAHVGLGLGLAFGLTAALAANLAALGSGSTTSPSELSESELRLMAGRHPSRGTRATRRKSLERPEQTT